VEEPGSCTRPAPAAYSLGGSLCRYQPALSRADRSTACRNHFASCCLHATPARLASCRASLSRSPLSPIHPKGCVVLAPSFALFYIRGPFVRHYFALTPIFAIRLNQLLIRRALGVVPRCRHQPITDRKAGSEDPPASAVSRAFAGHKRAPLSHRTPFYMTWSTVGIDRSHGRSPLLDAFFKMVGLSTRHVQRATHQHVIERLWCCCTDNKPR